MRRTGEASKGRKTATDKQAGATGKRQAAHDVDALLKRVTSVLEDFKAQNIVVIPLAGQASFADYMVVATGTSTRHASSMGQALEDKLGKEVLHIDGQREGEWVCADLGDIVVHVFTPEKRAMYNLEKLWSFAFDPTDSATE